MLPLSLRGRLGLCRTGCSNTPPKSDISARGVAPASAIIRSQTAHLAQVAAPVEYLSGGEHDWIASSKRIGPPPGTRRSRPLSLAGTSSPNATRHARNRDLSWLTITKEHPRNPLVHAQCGMSAKRTCPAAIHHRTRRWARSRLHLPLTAETMNAVTGRPSRSAECPADPKGLAALGLIAGRPS